MYQDPVDRTGMEESLPATSAVQHLKQDRAQNMDCLNESVKQAQEPEFVSVSNIKIEPNESDVEDDPHQPLKLIKSPEIVPVLSIKEELPAEATIAHVLVVPEVHAMDGLNTESEYLKTEDCSGEDPLSHDEEQSESANADEEVKKKWKNLRDCYAKHLRAEKTRTGQAAKSMNRYKTWPRAKQMPFFSPFLQCAIIESNIAIVDSVFNSKIDESESILAQR